METPPVLDWTVDFDHLDPAWQGDPYPIWATLRQICPVAHTSRYGGASLPTRYADVKAIAFDTARFSSRQIILRRAPLGVDAAAPPLTADPPHHRAARHLLTPLFRSDRIARLAPFIRQCCGEALSALRSNQTFDAAADFAHPVAARVLARFLGLPERELPAVSAAVETILDEGVIDPALASSALVNLRSIVLKQLARQRSRPGDGALGDLLRYRKEGQPLPDAFVVATVRLLLAAGMNTTSSALGAAIWHLARHAEDRRRLVAGPDAMPLAVEEFLRLYAPVTMAREVVETTEIAGSAYTQGEFVLLSYPAANRDPETFPDPDLFRPDRTLNPHFAFGTGIHRCLGAELARLTINIGLTEWLARCPVFSLVPDADVVWSRGSVRGPIKLPVLIEVA